MADFGGKTMHVQNSENNFPNEICEGKCSPNQDGGVSKGCHSTSPSQHHINGLSLKHG